MVKSIEIMQYRKFKDIKISFSKGINAISGTNGTCKTSLLHLISNSFQAVNKSCDWIREPRCIPIINAINTVTNPKVESLTRGDRMYNDPARGFSGVMFTVDYYTHTPLGFRRHNSKINTRYAVKPMYQKGSGDALPFCPVIYLGLARLYPFGEFTNDEAVQGIEKKLPEEYQAEIANLYRSFTRYGISFGKTQKMGDIKVRAEFDGDREGIDSNTISAGEDNLYIILTALVSLRYYYESITSEHEVESILLVDELDATLHPAFQIKLLRLLSQYANEYRIQIIFTTHSLTLMEEALKYKYNVIYLLDNITDVHLMENPDIYKIKMHLQQLTDIDIYKDKVIPIFTEDDEALFVLEHLISYFEKTHLNEFGDVRRFLHFVRAKAGADVLTGIFTDTKIPQMVLKSICILDGDHNSDMHNCIISLPGHKSPEQFLIDYAYKLYDDDSSFWIDPVVTSRGISKLYYQEFKAEIDQFEEKIQAYHEDEVSTKGMRRDFNKELFKKHKLLFDLLLKHWLHNPDNATEINRFYYEMRAMFKKVAPYNDIDSNIWK